MKRSITLLFFGMMFLFTTLSGSAQPREWTYPEIQISQEDESFLKEAKFRADAGYWALALPDYQKVADNYRGTSVEAELLFTIANLTGWIEGGAARDSVIRSISTKFPNSVYDYEAQYDLAQKRAGRRSLDATYGEYTLAANDISGLDLADAIFGGNPETSRAIRQLHFEKRIVLETIYSSLVNQFRIKQRYQEQLALCRFGRSVFDFEDRTGYFARRTAVTLRDTVGPQAREIATLPGLLELQPVSPKPNDVITPQDKISFSIATGDFRKAPTDLSSLRVSLDGLDVTQRLGIQVSYDYSLSSGSNYELILGELSLALSPGSHRIEVRVSAERVHDTEPDEVSRTWSFIVSDNPPSGPSTEILPAIKDALIYEKSQHSNEGANPLLTLEKINGKAARNLLGFNLASLTTNGLTKATLVLSIDASQGNTGWGNGETVSVGPVTTPWLEGNGKTYGLSNSQKFIGSGSGTTWFSPIDENISNTFANSVTQWNGGATYASQGTAPALVVGNHQTGALRFDVTQDVLNGAPNGWLLRKNQENKGSKVSFYSREGAAAAGNSDLAPRLILEYGNTSAQASSNGLLARLFNFYHRAPQLTAVISESERPTLKRTLQQSPVAAFVGEQFVTGLAGQRPFVKMGVRAAYRSWLRGAPTLALEELERIVS